MPTASVAGSKASIILLPVLGPLRWFDRRSLGSISFSALLMALPPGVLNSFNVEEKMQIPLPIPRHRNYRFIFSKPAKGTRACALQFRRAGRSSAAGSRRDGARWLIDRAGRKTLSLAGSTLQFVSFAAVGWLCYVKGSGVAILIFVISFVAGHAVGNGVACWVIISEIYQTKVRGRAMSIATTALWLVGYLGNQLFPVLQQNLGSDGTFWCFSAGALLTIVLVGLLVPETKERSLEEINEIWAPRTALSSSMHSC